MTETQKKKLAVIAIVTLLFTPLLVLLLGWWGIYIAIFWGVLRGMVEMREP